MRYCQKGFSFPPPSELDLEVDPKPELDSARTRFRDHVRHRRSHRSRKKGVAVCIGRLQETRRQSGSTFFVAFVFVVVVFVVVVFVVVVPILQPLFLFFNVTANFAYIPSSIRRQGSNPRPLFCKST